MGVDCALQIHSVPNLASSCCKIWPELKWELSIFWNSNRVSKSKIDKTDFARTQFCPIFQLLIKVFCHKIFDGKQKPNWIHCELDLPHLDLKKFPPGRAWHETWGKCRGKNSHQQNWHIRWQCRSMFWSVWFLWYHVDTFPRLKGKKEICMYWSTDYGHTKAKSLTLCGPNSNPNPK